MKEENNTLQDDEEANDVPHETNHLQLRQGNTQHNLPDSLHLFQLSDHIETELLDILTTANVPNYLYANIMEWAQKANQHGYHFNPQRKSRQQQIKYLQQWLSMENIMPEVKQVQIPESSITIKVTRFDFVVQLLSLLQNENFVRIGFNIIAYDCTTGNIKYYIM